MQGKTVTWSFSVQAGSNYSPSGSSLGVTFYTGTGTDLGPFVGHPGEIAQINTSQTISTTGTRYLYTFTVPTNATSARFNLAMPPTGTAGANDYYDITNMQLEIGSVATAFSRAGATIGGELALCQRYYYRAADASSTFGSVGLGMASSTTASAIWTQFPVSMRVKPTSVDFANLILSDAVGTITVTALSIDSNVTSISVGATQVNGTGQTQYRPMYLRQNSSSAGYIAFNAEL